MANTLKSWMILNNATADIPAAGTTGAHDFDTSKRLPFYDDGAVKQPYRDSSAITLLAGAAVTFSPAASPAYTAFGNPTQTDFTPFREARLHLTGLRGSANVTMKAVDVTNTLDVTGTVDISSATSTHVATAWTNILSTTYAGDAIWDLYGLESTTGATTAITQVYLELR